MALSISRHKGILNKHLCKNFFEKNRMPVFLLRSEYRRRRLNSNNESIVIRNGKIVWKHRPYCWCFCLNLNYLGWPYRAYIKTAKNGNFCLELLSKNDFETVLVMFCCYDHGAKASDKVQKIATDQKEYRKYFLCVIICWIAKI